jgi:hypothetical protein
LQCTFSIQAELLPVRCRVYKWENISKQHSWSTW